MLIYSLKWYIFVYICTCLCGIMCVPEEEPDHCPDIVPEMDVDHESEPAIEMHIPGVDLSACSRKTCGGKLTRSSRCEIPA